MRARALLFLLLASLPVALQAEQPDSTFNSNGRYIYGELGTLAFRAVATLPQPGGKVVSVFQFPLFSGFCAEPRCIGMVLFNAAGQPELVRIYANSLEQVTAATVDSSGRIVVVAQTITGASGRDIHVARFLPESLGRDLRFANGVGWINVSFNTRDEYPAAVAVDRLDRIVVAGSFSYSATDTDFGFVRLRSDGALDTSFNGTGMRAVPFDLGSGLILDQANAVSVGNDGRIIAVGNAFDASISRIRVAVTRLNSNGTYDTGFCDGGCQFSAGYSGTIRDGRTIYVFAAQTAHSDEGLAIDTLGSGGYVIAGATYANDGSNRRGVLARFNDAGGFVAERIGLSLGDNGVYRSIKAVDALGTRILVAGNSGPSDNFLLVQAFDAVLAPIVNYGNCHPQNNGFCPIFASSLADHGPDVGASIQVDATGRPLFQAQGVALEGGLPAIMTARYTNTSGPKPDIIYRHGFN